MAKILVTGITGNVGTYLYQSLAQMKEDIIGAVTSVNKSASKFEGVELVEFDFLNKETYKKALADVDRVFLMRPPHIGKPEDLYAFIDEMKESGVKFVVFLSLMGIEKNTIPPHYKIEKYIERVGLNFCHIRPGFFMQNLSGVHAYEIKTSNKIFIPAGKSKCSFIDAKDIGYAMAVILNNYEKHIDSAYTITGEKALDYYEVADLMTGILGRKIEYAKPFWLSFRQKLIHERKLEKKMVNVMVMLYFMTRMGTASAVHNDFSKITGQKPRSFEQFIMDNKAAWQ